MAESHNVWVTRELARIVSERRYEDVEQHLHPEIIVDVPFPAFFQGPIRRGAKQIAAGFAFIPHVFSSFILSITDVWDCPDQSAVVFEQTSSGVFVANGAHYANRYLMIFGFRAGKVVLWREYFNPEIMNNEMAPLLGFG
jgi:ketosteroid isomerase-like protein